MPTHLVGVRKRRELRVDFTGFVEVRPLRSKDVQRGDVDGFDRELIPDSTPRLPIFRRRSQTLCAAGTTFDCRRNNCGRCSCKMFFTVRSERLLMEQLRYNMLFRWFVRLSIDEPV